MRTHIGLGDEVGVATYGTSGNPGLPGDIRMAVIGRPPTPGKEATTAPAGARMVTSTLEPSSMKVCPSSRLEKVKRPTCGVTLRPPR